MEEPFEQRYECVKVLGVWGTIKCKAKEGKARWDRILRRTGPDSGTTVAPANPPHLLPSQLLPLHNLLGVLTSTANL